MAKLCDLLRDVPADFVQARIWNMVDPLQGRVSRQHWQTMPRRESGQEIFRAGQGQGVRKRVRANCTPSTGSIVAAVRVGTYTTCVCKCKM